MASEWLSSWTRGAGSRVCIFTRGSASCSLIEHAQSPLLTPKHRVARGVQCPAGQRLPARPALLLHTAVLRRVEAGMQARAWEPCLRAHPENYLDMCYLAFDSFLLFTLSILEEYFMFFVLLFRLRKELTSLPHSWNIPKICLINLCCWRLRILFSSGI